MTSKDPQRRRFVVYQVALALLLSSLAVRSQGLDFLWRDAPELLTSVTFGEGTFVAIGNDLIILVSKDGTNWVRKTAELLNPVMEFTYTTETYAAGGDAVTIIYPEKSSGSKVVPALHAEYQAVGFGGGNFVIVGDFGWILTSRTADTWTTRRSGTTFGLTAVCWGENMFVAVGEGGTLLASADAKVWRGLKSPTKNALRSVAYGNGIFVAVGDETTILTSIDGDHWIEQEVDWVAPLANVAFGNNHFMIAASEGGGSARISENGRVWREIFSLSSSKVQLSFAGSQFIATTRDVGPKIVEENSPGKFPDTPTDFVNRHEQFFSVTHGNGLFVSVGSHIETSKDCVNWQRQTTPPSKLIWGNLWRDGAFMPNPLPNRFFASVPSLDAFPLKSTDGVTWISKYATHISGMVHGNVRIYPTAMEDSETVVLTSDEGVIWTRLKPVSRTRP